jgi:hypothetical protein
MGGGRGETYRGFWWGNLRERDHFGDPAVDGRGKRRGVYRVLVGKPEGKRPLGRLGGRWEKYIKMDLQ